MQVFSRGCGEPLRCFYSMNKDLNREKLSIFVLRHKIDHFIAIAPPLGLQELFLSIFFHAPTLILNLIFFQMFYFHIALVF